MRESTDYIEAIEAYKDDQYIKLEPWEKSIDHLKLSIIGKENTPYSQGRFIFEIKFPENYPFFPPYVHAITPIWHPNINNSIPSSKLNIFLDLINPDLVGKVDTVTGASGWSPSLTLNNVIEALKRMLFLEAPFFNPNDPLNHEVGRQYIQAPKKFEIKAKKWTSKYALISLDKPLKLISFRGTQIPQFEAKVLQEIETLIKMKNVFKLVEKFKQNTKIHFTTENSRITGINICNYDLETLPESIGKLQSLKILELRENKLVNLPESISNLQSLKTLGLSENKLTTLPETIGNLSSLQTLDLSSNQLTTLPESIGNLDSLKILNLRCNMLNTLPESIENLRSLQKLFLSSNHLTTLPSSISNLNSLQYLYLDDNQLNTLPDSLLNIKSLQQLWLSANELKELPEPIFELKLLKKLYLSNNQLKILPNSIGNLSSLQVLYLDNNKFDKIPTSICLLKDLKTLVLNGNPLREEYKIIATKDIETILKFCRKNFENEKKIEFENKFHIIETLIQEKKITLAKKELNNVIQEAKLQNLNGNLNFLKKELRMYEDLITTRERTEKIIRILKFEVENQRKPTKIEMIKNLNFNLDEIDQYLDLLNSSISYDQSERHILKTKAEEVIKELDTLTLYDLINNLGFDFDTARKVGKYLIDESLIKEFPIIPKKEIKVLEREIKIDTSIEEPERVSLTKIEKPITYSKKEKKTDILVFASYSTKDAELFKISEIARTLRTYNEIENVLFYEGESYDNFIKYMNDNLGKCDVVLLFCSPNALISVPVEKEWTAADAMGKPIIPVFVKSEHIPPLLKSRLGVEFDSFDFQKNIKRLYELILKKAI